MKKNLLLILLCTSFFSFGQTIGDYRSANSGNWETLTSWEYFNGKNWITPSTSQGYPGQLNNTHITVIQPGHTIEIGSSGISTQPFETLTINGSLLLTGLNNTATFFTIKAHAIIVTPNLTPLATIEFNNKGILQLPADGSLQVTPGGLIGDCTNNQSIYIGDYEYSVCKGGGGGATFDEVMDAGGTLNTVPSSNSPIFVGETILLTGDYIGPPGESLSFEWTITDPLNNITTTTDQNTSIPNAIEGVYSAKFTCFTTYSGIPYSNFETISVIVNHSEAINGPVATPGTGATCNEIVANWEVTAGAKNYYLDVATDINFINFVPGYQNLDVGNVLSKKVTGLTNATTYYYRVYASNGTVLSPRSNTISYATLTTPNGLTATVTAQPTCSSATGTVTLSSPYLADPRYEYNADGGPYQSSNIFTGLTPGSHVFTVRFLGENSCISDPAVATINESLKIPVADAGQDFTKTCKTNSSGQQIGAPAVDGVSYSWTPTEGLSDATISNPIADPTVTTTYTLTATQTAGGCTATDTITITVVIDPPNASAGADFTKTCTNFQDGKTIGSAPQTGISYNWSPSTGLSSSTISNPVANPDVTTNYTLVATNNITGCSLTDTILVTVNTTPPIAEAGLDFSKTCVNNPNGNTIGGQAMPKTQYLWSPETGLSSANAANPTANPTVTTTYTLETTNTANGCIAQDSVLVTVDSTTPTANAGSPFTKTCTQFPTGKEIGAPAELGTTYSWNPSNGLSITTVSNPIANPTVSTTYTVTATNTNSGCTSSDSVDVTVQADVPVADAGADFTKSCIANISGKTIGTNAVAGTAYSWSPSTGLTDPLISNPTANPTVTTTYTLTATNLTSHCTATDQVTVFVNTTAPKAIAGSDFTKNCTLNPAGAQIGDTAIAGLTYNWVPATGLSNPIIANPIANPNSSTTYTLTTTDPINGCTNSDSVTVTVNIANPIANAGADFTKTCTLNPSGKSIGVPPVTGTTYRWSPATGLSSTTVSNPTANPTTTTTYTLTVTGANGCTATDEIIVTVNTTTPNSDIAGIDKTINCSIPTTSIGSASQANISYSWSPVEGLSDATISNPIASPIKTTVYTLTAINTISSCKSDDTVIVTVNKTPPSAPIPATPTQPTCDTPTGNVVLNGLPSENWTISIYKNSLLDSTLSGFGNTVSISSLVEGTYYFTVTVTASGCISSASANVVINPQPPIPSAPQIGTITDPTCAIGGSVVLNNLPPIGTWTLHQTGTNSNQIQGSGSSTTVSGLHPGTYQYFVVSDAGCISPVSSNVVMKNVSSGATLDTVIQPTCTASTGSVSFRNLPTTGWTITQTGPLNNVITVANPSPATYTIAALIPGDYNFTIDSGSLCLTVGLKATINSQPQTPLAPNVAVTNPSCGVSEATITVSNLPSGRWTIQLFDSASALIKTIIGTGTTYSTIGVFPAGNYTLSVTNDQGCTSVPTPVFTINPQPLPLATPTIVTITQPICGTPTGSVVINGLPATGTWTLTQSGAASATYTGSGTSFTVSGLTEGQYNFVVSGIAGTCPSQPTEMVFIESPKVIPTVPTIVSITQPTCKSNTGTIDLSGLPQDAWVLYASPPIGNGSGLSGSGTTASLTGAVVGTYTITVQNSDGCYSPSTPPFTINPQPPTPAIPVLSTPIQPTCTVATGSFIIQNYDSNNTYTVSPNTGVTITGNTITAPKGSYTVTATLGTCTSNASALTVINQQPQTPTAPLITNVIQPNCDTATGNVVLNGLPSENWTISIYKNSVLDSTLSGFGSTISINGLAQGTYYFTVTTTAFGCVSPASANVIINAQPPIPSVPQIGTITDPTCAIGGSVVLNNLPPTGTWTLHQTGTNNNQIQGSGSSTTVSGLLPGTYQYFVVSDVGCVSPLSANVVMNDVSSGATLKEVIHPTCASSTGSISFANLPTTGWTITQTGPINNVITIADPSPATYTINALIAGDYNFTLDSGSICLTVGGNITINPQPQTPLAPNVAVTNPSCGISEATITVSNLPTGNWTIQVFDSTSSVIKTLNGTGTSYNTTGIFPPGNYTLTVTNEQGCTSVPSTVFAINSQPLPLATPTIGTITQPICGTPTGSVVINGLPASGTWTLTQSGAASATYTGSGTSFTVSRLTEGQYNFTVSGIAETCPSQPTETVFIDSAKVIPTVPTIVSITQPSCKSNTGTIELSGLPQDTWVLYATPPIGDGSGLSGSGTTATLTGAVTGTYTITVQNADGCYSPSTPPFTINPQPPTPAIPVLSTPIQPTCTVATGCFIIQNYDASNSYTVNPNTGVTISGNTITAPNGNYTVTATLGNCSSNASAVVTINQQPQTPAAPVIANVLQPNCDAATGTVLLNGLPSENWTISIYKNSVLDSTLSGFGTTISINGLTEGTYYFTVSTTAFGCISPASANAIINAQPPLPSAPQIGTITDPTCAVGGSVVLNNLPATGTWTLHQTGTSNDQIQGSGSSITVSGLLPGTYQYFVVSDLGCVSPLSANVVMNNISSGATLEEVIHPTCTLSTGSVSFGNLPTTGWTITQTGPINNVITIPHPSPATYTITALISGDYNFTLDSGSICSAVGGNVTINPQPQAPLAPIVAVTNPSCGVSETTIAISNLPSGRWAIQVFDSSSSVIKTITGTGTTYNTTGIFSPGNYTLTVANDQGCTSVPTPVFTINAQPLPLVKPSIGTITQPICETPTGSVVINGLPASGTWTLNQSGTASATYTGSGTSFTVSGLTEGNYNYSVTGIVGSCPSEATETVVIDSAKVIPTVPTIVSITQPTCQSNTGTIELSGLPQGSWILYSTPPIGDGTGLSGFGTTAFLTGAVVGTYTISVQNSDGCYSPSTPPFTLNPQPTTPAIPLLSTPIQPTCTVATGSFTIENYDANNVYTVTPDTGVTISGNTITAPSGNYTVTATFADCSSNASAVVAITEQPQTPTPPIIVNVTQPTCDSNTGSIELSGLPVDTWTLFASPAIGDGTGLSGSGTTAILTGAIVGTYTITVKNSDSCISASSLPFTLNEQPPTPPIPTLSTPIQPTCTVATGSFVITNYNSNCIYNVSPAAGVTISGNTITAPTGNYTVTATLGNCTSGTSSVVEIDEQPLTPTPPIIGTITQPDCTSEKGSVEVSGLPTGSWTLYSAPAIIAGGSGLQGIGTTVFFNSMPSGSYTLTVKNSVGCISANSAPFTINPQPVTPAVPVLSAVIHPTCLVSTGTFTINNYDANNSYSVNPSTGVTISGNLITAPAGNYTVFATLGNCTSAKSETVTINPQPVSPTPPIIDFVTQATCQSSTASIALSGLPESNWILTSSGGRTLAGQGTTAILTGNTVAGNYYVTVTNMPGCTSSPSANVILNAQPITPNPPTVGTITQPGCVSETGTVVISDPAEGTGFEYNIDGGAYQASATFSNIAAGIHKLGYRSLVPESCISMTTTVEIEEPLLVNAPIIKTIIPPDCISNGSILLEGLPTGNWTLFQSGTAEQTIQGSGTSTTVSNLETGTYSYRVSNGSCLSKTTPNVLLKPLESTAWTGTKWTNGLPSIDKYVYMNGNYSFGTDSEMCRCQVISGFIYALEGVTISIINKLEILNGGHFIFNNTASLIQESEVTNIGKINYNRLSTPVYKSDYVFWSSPVALQQLDNASPNTPTNEFFSFDADANNWKEEKPYNHMRISKGYSIGSPNGFNEQNLYSYPIDFFGVPNNGTITTESINEGKSYLIGNPYPSSVIADQFLDANKAVLNGTIYFWSHNPQSATLSNASNDYAPYNATGGAGIAPKDPVTNINNTIPLGFIAAGQSFFIQGKEGVSGVKAKFDNTMRIAGNNAQFFKFSNTKKDFNSIEKDRVWLNLYNNQGAFKQTLVGYITGATNEFDSAYDGAVFNGNKYVDFYSINQNKNLVIQGRALPFDENDTVPLGFSTTIDGLFEINIDQADGVLANHDIYLEDKQTAVFYNLRNAPYRFNTSKGTFDNRFVLHYKNEVPSQEKLDHPVIVSLKDGIIKVNSFFEVIDKLEIYDMTGKFLFKQENVNINEYYIREFHSNSNQPLIVKTTLKNKDVVATKIIYTSFGN